MDILDIFGFVLGGGDGVGWFFWNRTFLRLMSGIN